MAVGIAEISDDDSGGSRSGVQVEQLSVSAPDTPQEIQVLFVVSSERGGALSATVEYVEVETNGQASSRPRVATPLAASDEPGNLAPSVPSSSSGMRRRISKGAPPWSRSS